ncbi:MAG: division/cell wall cluster transcriptional repressor MraZ [Armatimonadota bacterium]
MDLHGATVNPVDASGRITLREHQIDELDGSVILTLGFDNNIYMFTPEQWPHFVEPLKKASPMDPDMDDLRRLFMGGAVEVEFDARGRMKIPEALRTLTNLQPGQSKAIVLNIGTRWEIWEEGAYQAHMEARREALKEFARKRFGSGGDEETEAAEAGE